MIPDPRLHPPSTSTPPPQAGVTRLAPSPTGALHLGNARTFLVNWALARQRGWRTILRIEDLDGPRVKPEAAAGIVDTLAWLGMGWDEGPLVQSADLAPYRRAMAVLAGRGLAYPSVLSRGQVEAAASAPQAGSHEVAFPASLRPEGWDRPREFADDGANWRFAAPAGPAGVVEFVDAIAGPQRISPAESVGDFVLWTRRGTPAYQLAVVVDDARQGVTDVVRGDDLLDSAARQTLLYRALELGPPPHYAHLPLVVGPDGRRLAKRHGDSRVETYRAAGVPADGVVGLVAFWCGVTREPRPMAAGEFAAGLDASTIPRSPIVFTTEQDRWLRSLAR